MSAHDDDYDCVYDAETNTAVPKHLYVAPPEQPNPYDALPEQMKTAKAFLLWKLEGGGVKPRKVPYYTNGKPRSGTMEAPADLAQLATFDTALAAYQAGKWNGIGIAVGAAFPCVAVDFDGRIPESFEVDGAWTEISQSGKGLHAFYLPGTTPTWTGNNGTGTELYTEKRFIALTGKNAAGAMTPYAGQWDAYGAKASTTIRERSNDRFAALPDSFWTAEPMHAALKHLDPGLSRSDWRMVGFACLAQLGEIEGFALWNAWSTNAPDKYSEAASKAEWKDIVKRHKLGEGFGVGSMLKLLPKGTVAEIRRGVGVLPQSATLHPLADFCEAEPEGDMRDGEFVLDYLIAAGMVLVAGAPGVGKTTQLIPLMTIVAHACPPDHELLPELRRNVIYITEDPAQARNIIASLRDAGWFGALSKRDIGERFKIVTAKRLSSEVIAEVSSIYLAMGVTNINPETGDTHVAHPVVVFDTTSATIELDNENDNAEVGSAVASLKENFASKGIPVILVAHIAKNLNRADVGDLSVRGASAWIGDVQQVTFLLKDNDDESRRWLEIAHPVAKHRFEPMGDGIEFDLCTRTIPSTSVLGRVREVKRSHGVPKLIIRGQRLIEKRARADFNKTAAENALAGKIRSTIQAHQEKADTCYMTKNEVAKEVEGGRKTILATIDKMVEDNILEFADFAEFPKRHHTHTVGYRVRVVGF